MKKWNCKECDTSWFSHSAICKHYVEVHKKIANICHYCGHYAKSRYSLPGHIKLVHEKIRDIPCDLCDEVNTLWDEGQELNVFVLRI